MPAEPWAVLSQGGPEWERGAHGAPGIPWEGREELAAQTRCSSEEGGRHARAVALPALPSPRRKCHGKGAPAPSGADEEDMCALRGGT